MAQPTGLDAALAEQLQNQGDLRAREQQLELNDIAALPLLGPVKADGKVITAGRPKGSLNKATKELASYILARHRHPVIAAAEICDMPIKALAAELSCEYLDAAKYQQQCREFVARYTLQAMPQAVSIDMSTVGMLMVINQNAPKPGEDAAASPYGLGLKIINENKDAPAASHGVASHEKE